MISPLISKDGGDRMAELDENLNFTAVKDQPNFLEDLVTDKALALTEFKRRKSDFTFKSVHTADVEDHIQQGWEVARTGKRQCRLRKPKAHHRLLEDRAWCFLYRMGNYILDLATGLSRTGFCKEIRHERQYH